MANDPNDPVMAPEENKPTLWISIPSIPAHRVGQGLLAFLLAIAVVTAIDVLLITHNHRPATWPLAAEMVFDDGSSIVAWSLPLTWPLMEAIRMVLAGIWEKRNRRRHIAQGFEQGKTVGREEAFEEGIEVGVGRGAARANNAWRDWVQRKEDAAANGVPFDEPMPDSNDHRNGSSSNPE